MWDILCVLSFFILLAGAACLHGPQQVATDELSPTVCGLFLIVCYTGLSLLIVVVTSREFETFWNPEGCRRRLKEPSFGLLYTFHCTHLPCLYLSQLVLIWSLLLLHSVIVICYLRHCIFSMTRCVLCYIYVGCSRRFIPYTLHYAICFVSLHWVLHTPHRTLYMFVTAWYIVHSISYLSPQYIILVTAVYPVCHRNISRFSPYSIDLLLVLYPMEIYILFSSRYAPPFPSSVQ